MATHPSDTNGQVPPESSAAQEAEQACARETKILLITKVKTADEFFNVWNRLASRTDVTAVTRRHRFINFSALVLVEASKSDAMVSYRLGELSAKAAANSREEAAFQSLIDRIDEVSAPPWRLQFNSDVKAMRVCSCKLDKTILKENCKQCRYSEMEMIFAALINHEEFGIPKSAAQYILQNYFSYPNLAVLIRLWNSLQLLVRKESGMSGELWVEAHGMTVVEQMKSEPLYPFNAEMDYLIDQQVWEYESALLPSGVGHSNARKKKSTRFRHNG